MPAERQDRATRIDAGIALVAAGSIVLVPVGKPYGPVLWLVVLIGLARWGLRRHPPLVVWSSVMVPVAVLLASFALRASTERVRFVHTIEGTAKLDPHRWRLLLLYAGFLLVTAAATAVAALLPARHRPAAELPGGSNDVVETPS